MGQKTEKKIKKAAAVLLGSLLLLVFVFVLKAWLGGHFQSVEALRTYLGSYGSMGPVILVLIQALQVVLPVLPGFLGCIVGAAMFGAAGGFWINYIGISAGSLIAYWLARRFGADLVREMVPDKNKKGNDKEDSKAASGSQDTEIPNEGIEMKNTREGALVRITLKDDDAMTAAEVFMLSNVKETAVETAKEKA